MNHINTHGITTKYRLSSKEVAKFLADLKPEMEVPFGSRMMKLYDPAKVDAIIGPIVEARRAPKAPEPAPAPEPASPPVDLNPLVKRMVEMLNTIEDLQAANEKLHASVQQVTSQHAVLLKAIEKVGLDLGNRIDALQQTVDQMELLPLPVAVGPIEAGPATTAPPPVAPQIKAVEPAGPKRKVTIIGLFDAHATHIYREFKDVFDLRIFNIDEAKGSGVMNRMKDSEAVFIMTKFVNHSVENLAKAAGIKPIRVTGGQTAIRDKLTELYCNPPQQAA